MSDQESGQEKTEQPTERRLREAIEQGQVLTSKDLAMSIVLLVASVQFYFLGRNFFNEMLNTFRNGLDITGPLARDIPLLSVLADRFGSALLLVLMFGAPLALAPIVAQALFGGFHFTIENLAFKGNRISPLTGLGRMFGMHSLIELGKSILKVLTIGTVGFWFLMSKLPDILSISSAPFESAMQSTGMLFLLTLLVLVGAIAPKANLPEPAIHTDAEVVSEVVSARFQPKASVHEHGLLMEKTVREVTDSIQKFIQANQRQFRVSKDDVSGYMVVQVIDPNTGEVIRTLPSDELLRLARSFEMLGSTMVHQKA